MQKAYSRINWKDEPSLDTPLGANNLNKMDSALDVIDNRVLSLSGYEGRVQASEKNAKASEVNAKTSENNAKESEELAKQYMESAFDTTPEGYAEIVDKVEKMDIQESTSTTLLDSKEGGYKLLSMSGNSVQKTYNGNQLANLPNVNSVTYNGITWSCKDGVVAAKGTASASSSSIQIGIYYDLPIVAGTYFVSGNQGSVAVYASIVKADGSRAYPTNSSFTLDGTETLARVYCQVNSGCTVDTTVYPFVNKGATKLQEEPYVGGIPSPNPDFPQSINNVGDCVEIMQGFYSTSTGAWASGTTAVCNKNPIPCSSGDVIAINTEKAYTIRLFFYNDTGFLSATTLGGTSVNGTAPSGATYFNIALSTTADITPDTVGKISLTINGKYVVQIVENGKNLLQNKASTTTSNGVTFTVNKDGSVKANGTSSGTAYITLVTKMPLKKGAKYIFSGCPSGGSTTTHSSIITIYETSTKTIYDRGSSVEYTCNEDNVTFTYQTAVFNGTTVSNLTFYPMLRYANITDGTYEPYKEKVATVLLNAPLRDTDVMSNKEVVRNIISKVYRGSDDEGWTIANASATELRRFYVNIPDLVEDTLFKCSNFSILPFREGRGVDMRIYAQNRYICVTDSNSRWATVEDFKTYLASNPMTVERKANAPIVETLDSTSQIALNSLETFDTVTYINVDSRTQPKGIKGEYGTSKVGARTIKNELKNDTLEIKYNELVSTLLANNEVAEVEEVLEGDEE